MFASSSVACERDLENASEFLLIERLELARIMSTLSKVERHSLPLSPMSVKAHWEKIYREKAPESVSWFRAHLETSLDLITQTARDRSAVIIDVGGGESTLVDLSPGTRLSECDRPRPFRNCDRGD